MLPGVGSSLPPGPVHQRLPSTDGQRPFFFFLMSPRNQPPSVPSESPPERPASPGGQTACSSSFACGRTESSPLGQREGAALPKVVRWGRGAGDGAGIPGKRRLYMLRVFHLKWLRICLAE
ncbi:hypothetical protein HJG60_011791 [Phyllostomus discolor]|uniref:Uncharacterized protein n=1 Tax=Phyllostomus discolor TaxID=89673 RepID=A0A833ZPE9_9CHIR|nr:hypothetical protein HJG60_011791 [Phyllostomus discolor]